MLMAHGLVKHEWNMLAQHLCLLANCNRNEQKRPNPFTPADFNPFMDKPEEKQATGFDDFSSGMIATAKHNRFSKYHMAG